MMINKNIFILLLSTVLISNACQEEPPFIDMSKKNILLLDTSYYINPIPAAQLKNVLLEDVSGVKCSNCPKAAEKAEDLLNVHQERLAVLTLMPDKNLLAEFTDFAPDYANVSLNKVNQLLNFLTPPGAMPIGMIDRTDHGNGLMSVFPLWADGVNIQMAKTTNVNIELETAFESSLNQLLVTVTTIYTQTPLDTNQNITLVLNESKIIGKQKTPTGDDTYYEFKHIVREYATLPVGDPLPTPKAGLAVKRQYIFDIPSNWKLANCEVVAFVHSSKSKIVFQAQKKKAI